MKKFEKTGSKARKNSSCNCSPVRVKRKGDGVCRASGEHSRVRQHRKNDRTPWREDGESEEHRD